METFKEKWPMVSVVMATYNDPLGYLNLSVESIIKQTYKNWELLIVDDSTKSEVIDTLDAFAKKDSRIKIVRKNYKLGFVKSLNVGIQESSGTYIARMDSDDISKLNRLEKEVAFLEENRDIDIVGSNIEIIDEKSTVIGNRTYKVEEDKIKRNAFFRNPLAHPSVMYRRQSIIKLSGYDENYKMAEDYELWLRALKFGMKISTIPEVLLSYRMGNDYYKKRSKENWKYNILAKKKNFYWSVYNIAGILLSLILYNLPIAFIRKLYEIDRKKGDKL